VASRIRPSEAVDELLRRATVGRGPSNDLWIAATAIAHDLELITADERQAALPYVRAQLV
jgi:tRNA(fMet)-specific endonuclease VapC